MAHQSHLVNPSLEESLRFLNSNNNNNSFTNLITEAMPSQNTQCFIYGIANKAFVDDYQASLYNPDNKQSFEASYLCSFNPNNNNPKLNIPSSFRPNGGNFSNNNQNSASVLNKQASNDAMASKENDANQNESKMVDCNEKKGKQNEMMDEMMNKRDEPATYHAPWKLCNDYEALEANTVTGSMGNLSAVTTYSEGKFYCI